MAQFGTVNGHLNGHETTTGLGSPSTSAPRSRSASVAPTPSGVLGEYTDYYAELADHLLRGYTDTAYHDFRLHVEFVDRTQNSTFSLHALIVSRSPLLRSLLQSAFANSPHPTLLVSIPDPSITSSSFSLVLASLYSPTVLTHLSTHNCASILSTARYLGLERLAQQAFERCLLALEDLKTTEEIEEWVLYLERERETDETLYFQQPQPQSRSNGTLTSTSSKLRQSLLTRLTSLSKEYQAFHPTNSTIATEGQGKVIEVLKRLPFDWFKATIEDARFSTPSEMDRFNFAKKVVAARRTYFHTLHQTALSHTRTLSSTSSTTSSIPSSPLQPLTPNSIQTNSPNALPPGGGGQSNGGGVVEFDEAVVLGFGSGGTSAVNVLRKARKPNLWKIGPATGSGLGM
ncbi:hypothetical protein JCM16303_003335 [Sporobolomyces ruberrimus]